MSFGLGRGRTLDPAPGTVGISDAELPPIPDGAMSDPRSARVDPRAWFRDPDRPLEIEIGCGKGAFLLAHAAASPHRNLLGIEHAREFYEYSADRVRRAGLTNVRVLHADALAFLVWRVPDRSVDVIHLYFPDPWPKSRHHKRRIVQDPLLLSAARVLADDGQLRIVTDHADYWAWMESHIAPWIGPERDGRAGFDRLAFDAARSAGSGELVGTNFERKYRAEGRPFHALTLRRIPRPGPPA